MQNKTDNNIRVKPSNALTKAVKRILYPLVHLLLKTGITFPQLSEILKDIYIKVADNEFQINNKKQTQTRLSFLTGVHRKDVKRLHNPSSQDIEEAENISVGVKLVSKWITEDRFLDKHGTPLLLPLKPTNKNSPSFEELIAQVCKHNIRARVILDEWLNLGIVKIEKTGAEKRVRLCSEAFIPKDGENEKAFFLGQNISDHLNATTQNLLNDTPPFFERCVYYDELSDDSISELKDLVEQEGMRTLKILNERASQLKKTDKQRHNKDSKIESQRINIGLYLYHEKANLKQE